MSRPAFTVITGANGCGKSTLTRWGTAFFQQSPVLDPDDVAVDLRLQKVRTLSDMEAGREVLRAAEYFLQRCVGFSVETTLSGATYLRMLTRAKELGYTM